MAHTKHHFSLPPGLFDEFCNFAGMKGISISGFIAAKMKEFVEECKEEQRQKEELKKLKKHL